jgi:hypothetical protein
MRRCPACGRPLGAASRACLYCGARQDPAAAGAEAPTAPPPRRRGHGYLRSGSVLGTVVKAAIVLAILALAAAFLAGRLR